MTTVVSAWQSCAAAAGIFAPLYPRTLWRYTNAVIIIIITTFLLGCYVDNIILLYAVLNAVVEISDTYFCHTLLALLDLLFAILLLMLTDFTYIQF